jgi:hypothetical protein
MAGTWSRGKLVPSATKAAKRMAQYHPGGTRRRLSTSLTRDHSDRALAPLAI